MVTPPHIQPLLDAALRAFAWLVSNVVSLSGMIFNRNTRDWHTGIAEEGLRPTSNDITKGANSGLPDPRPAVDAQRRERPLPDHAHQLILRDDRSAIPQDEASDCLHDDKKALILRDQCKALIVSKDGGVLTALSPLIPTNVGIQGEPRVVSELTASTLHPQHNRSWIPTFVGMSG